MTRKIRSKFQQKTAQNFLNGARALYDRKLLTDVTLECEGREFAVHKMVLAANSPYFRDYFISEENISSPTMAVDFMTSKVLQVILDYFYTGRVVMEEKDILRSIIEASSTLQIPLLSNYCLGLLLNTPSTDISLSDWKAIEELHSEVIFNNFLQNIIKKLSVWNTTTDFLTLSANEINVCFHSPAVAECDQNIVFQSILNWIKQDPDGRKEHLTQFLENFVDFERLEPELLSQLANEELLTENMYFLRSHFKLVSKQSNAKVKKIIPEEKSSQQIGKPENILEKKILEGRKKGKSVNSVKTDAGYFKNQLKFFIFYYDDNFDESCIALFDYIKNEDIRMIAHPLQTKKHATIVYHEGSIYSFGGEHFDGGFYNNVYSYNMKTNQWMERNYMINGRSGSAAVVLRGCIYVLGGNDYDDDDDVDVDVDDDDDDDFTFIERYNLLTNDLEAVAPLSDINQKTIPVVAINNCLYTILNTKLYKYIPQDDTWYLVDIEMNKYFNTGEVHMVKGHNRIFIIEKKSPKTIWIYDPKENSFTEDLIPAVLTECDGILNLENPQCLEFLVSGIEKWFIYRPPHFWSPFDPKRLADYHISTLTLIPS